LEGKCVARPNADASIATTARRLIRKCHAAAVKASPTSRTRKKNRVWMSLVKGGRDVRATQMDSFVPVHVHAKNVETNTNME